METALTPMDFLRRSNKLYPNRTAVIDNNKSFTYRQFFERCNRWSSALQKLGIHPQDRVAYIAPNTHAQLESFYSVPQIGAIVVPINYRLAPEEFAYIINHSGARIVCVHSDYLDAVQNIRTQLPNVEHFVALEGEKDTWLDYEKLVASASDQFTPFPIHELDLIAINYTSGTTARPKGVMITHRNAYINILGTLAHCHLSVDECYLWTLPMFHANGWTFVWTITACGGKHICLRKVDAANIFHLIKQEKVSMFCAAPTILISIANAEESLRGNLPKGVRILTAGAPPAAATIERIEQEFGWELTQVYGLTETSPFITICEPLPEHKQLTAYERAVVKARQGVELISSGELIVVDDENKEVPCDGKTIGEIIAQGNVIMKGYYNDPEATNKAIRDGWFHSGDAAWCIRMAILRFVIGSKMSSSAEVKIFLQWKWKVCYCDILRFWRQAWSECLMRNGANPLMLLLSSGAGSQLRRLSLGNLLASTSLHLRNRSGYRL